MEHSAPVQASLYLKNVAMGYECILHRSLVNTFWNLRDIFHQKIIVIM